MSHNILQLYHDDTVYIAPPCMVGVPIARMVEGDPYWITTWTSYDQLEENMKRKLDDYKPADSKEYKIRAPGRSIDSFNELKKYFMNQGFHVNQLLSKQYVTGLGLIRMDLLSELKTIFDILHEARSVDVIKVEPLDWLRGRLAYLIDTEKSRHTLKALLETWQWDPEITRVRNVSDMILKPPEYTRPQPRAKARKRKREEEEGGSQNARNVAKKKGHRELYKKTYVKAHVNTYIKARMRAHEEAHQSMLEEEVEEVVEPSPVLRRSKRNKRIG